MCCINPREGHVLAYLDDHLLVSEAKSYDLAVQRLRDAYELFTEAMTLLGLKIEPSKCAFMSFQGCSRSENFQFPNGVSLPALK